MKQQTRREGDPMASFTATIHIARPPETVFAFLMRCENNLRWQAGVERAWQDTPGGIGVGTRVGEVRRFLGRRVTSVFEIVAYEPPLRCTTRAVRAPVPFEATYAIDDADGASIVTASGAIPDRSLPRIAARAACAVAQQEIEGDLRRLREVLEGEPLAVTIPERPFATTEAS
jgi:hypothetical protein